MLSQVIPVLPRQIAAGCRLHGRLTSWSAADNAFRIMRECVPGWDVEAALLKTAAVNQLYWTQIRLVWRMAVHISEVMEDRPSNPELLVEAIALLPPRDGQGEKQFHFWSFASKLCHFFVDSDKFPIYDHFSCAMVRYHLGKQGARSGNPYAIFAADVARLLDLSGLKETTFRQLDRYLWLAGQYRAWRGLPPYKKSFGGIGSEILGLFEDPTEDVRTLSGGSLGDSGGFPAG